VLEGQLARTFRVRGLPKSSVQVRVDLVIEHGERTDLRVTLQTPGKRRLPVYEGSLEEAGANVDMEDEAAPLFYGLNPDGNWVLRVIDTIPADSWAPSFSHGAHHGAVR
jgi:subtilisin-like proprotein convertase family protein